MHVCAKQIGVFRFPASGRVVDYPEVTERQRPSRREYSPHAPAHVLVPANRAFVTNSFTRDRGTVRYVTIALYRERDMNRRRFLAGAASLGIIGVWAPRSAAAASRIAWREDRASFPQGVASGDPDDHSVILWTRRPFDKPSDPALNQADRHALTA